MAKEKIEINTVKKILINAFKPTKQKLIVSLGVVFAIVIVNLALVFLYSCFESEKWAFRALIFGVFTFVMPSRIFKKMIPCAGKYLLDFGNGGWSVNVLPLGHVVALIFWFIIVYLIQCIFIIVKSLIYKYLKKKIN